ncbi:MAG: SAM-dependent chlorinase/fluorinase [Candidatus Sumerlaeia bacterium]
MASYPTIALLTDFGQHDWFVGVMHGVIRRIAPPVRVIDLCHNVPPQDVRTAAFVLDCSYQYFPDRTVFCCVVDPGVGTERAALCATDGRFCFVAPDNGLLTLVMQRAGAGWSAWKATNQRFFLPAVSATFQGRDVFSPLAAHLAMGTSLTDIGERVDSIATLSVSRPRLSEDRLAVEGEVAYVDQFGNLITTIQRQDAEGFPGNLRASHNWELLVNGRRLKGLARTFGELPAGEALFYWGSADYLEIGVNHGSAQQLFGAKPGTPVRLELG